ncbi:MAG: hypothetical protein C5B54_07520 [Acidobacteria bacterium]|nr:MAG: hypothetical protein C5B54_07520 [Acidobacteriota bacterium]
MPKIDVTVPHNLSVEEAVSRIKNLIGTMQKQYGDRVKNVQENWNGNHADFSFEVMGLAIAGNLSIEPSQMHVIADLPFSAMPFKKMIETTIKEKSTQLLS